MYLKILIDTSGNTEYRRPDGDFNIFCPFCGNKNIYIFNSDANLFCNSCGKQLVTKIEDIEGYAEEEIDEFIRLLKFGSSVYERIDAVIELGKVSRNNKRYGLIIEILSKISTADPEPDVREHAMESMKKLMGLIKTQDKKEKTMAEPLIKEKPKKEKKMNIGEELLSLLDGDKDKKLFPRNPHKNIQKTFEEEEKNMKSPYKTLKLPGHVIQEVLPSSLKKEYKTKKDAGKKTALNMEDELLSLLDDL